MATPQVGIDITARDKTAKGVLSARRALEKLPKAANDAGKAVDRANRSANRFSRGGLGGIVRTFGSVERASARAFGGTSVLGQVSGRLGAVSEAAAAVGTGMGEASVAGGVMAGALTAVGVVAAATLAAVAGLALGAYKLADGWAANRAGLGRLSQSIGIATQDLQAFQQAGERAGVSSASIGGALGGLAETANDARYGRNQTAAQTMAVLGIKPRIGADGNIDNKQLALDVADALAKQKNPQTAAKIAGNLGIGRDALPFFRQGSKAISGDLADVSKNGVINSKAEIDSAAQFVRDKARAGERLGKVQDRLGSKSAGASTAGLEAVLDGKAPSITAPKILSDAADTFRTAVKRFADGIDRAIGVDRLKGADAARAAQIKYGVPAAVTLAQAQLESGNGRHMPPGSNNPFGIKARKGEPYVTAMTSESINGQMVRVLARFRKFDSLADAFDAHAKLLATAKPYAAARAHADDPEAYADALTGKYATDPNYGEKLKRIMHQHTHKFEGLPAGVTVKTTTQGSDGVAIGRALP